ncbi:MAG TPA: guanylate kinase [Candidatus Saccharicenans sp.]|jgi:guanylate kinase|nr:guanylate kinase [Candidatus Saccharicenans sp.]HRD01638.1 guanylate kinase [Candidatus Saccharicenans sp.]
MIFVVSGPSGCGKSTLIKHLLSILPDLEFSVSHTTRLPRADEVNGRDYYFVSHQEFQKMQSAGAFAESAIVHGEMYGTSLEEIKNKSEGRDLVLDIDVQGARQIKSKLEEARLIFVVPPSFPELEKRLRQRRTDSPEAIALRLENARKEILESDVFDYLVINGELARAVDELRSIIVAHRCQFKERQKEFQEILISFKADSGF